MMDVEGDQSLYGFGMSLWKKGGVGMLVSGGCTPEGAVPIDRGILDQVRRLKDETGLLINMHTGLVGKETASLIASSGVDAISFDVLGDDSTIREVLKLQKQVEDYTRSYETLLDSGLNVVPHILAGFHFGKERGEKRAIDIVSGFEPDRAVLITLIPTKGTGMEDVQPMDRSELLSIARYMRDKIEGDLILGCMRPKGMSDMESEILKIGFNGIVLPSRKTLGNIKKEGWKTTSHDNCCAIG